MSVFEDFATEFSEFLDDDLLIGRFNETSEAGDPVRTFEPLYRVKGSIQKSRQPREVNLGGNEQMMDLYTLFLPRKDLDFKSVELTKEMFATRNLWFEHDAQGEYFKFVSVYSPLGSHWEVEARVVRHV